MLQFSLKALLLVVAVVAVACTVLFALPPNAGRVVLLIGVVALPGPLVVAYLRGSRRTRSFALGALVAYAVWLIVIAIPISFIATRRFDDYHFITWQNLNTFPVSSYTSLAALKLPWLMVLLAGLISLAVDWLVSDDRQTSNT